MAIAACLVTGRVLPVLVWSNPFLTALLRGVLYLSWVWEVLAKLETLPVGAVPPAFHLVRSVPVKVAAEDLVVALTLGRLLERPLRPLSRVDPFHGHLLLKSYLAARTKLSGMLMPSCLGWQARIVASLHAVVWR